MGEPRPAAGVEPGLLAASLAMALLLMAFGALATLGGALLLRLLSGIRIMTAISQAAAATFFILLVLLQCLFDRFGSVFPQCRQRPIPHTLRKTRCLHCGKTPFTKRTPTC